MWALTNDGKWFRLNDVMDLNIFVRIQYIEIFRIYYREREREQTLRTYSVNFSCLNHKKTIPARTQTSDAKRKFSAVPILNFDIIFRARVQSSSEQPSRGRIIWINKAFTVKFLTQWRAPGVIEKSSRNLSTKPSPIAD